MTTPLTTLAALEAYLGLDPGNADEAVLSQLVAAASGMIATYCNRDFLSASYTETRCGTGGFVLPLAATPITAVASLTIDGLAVPAGSAVAAGYFFLPTLLMLNGYRFTRGLGNVTVSYTAGYATVPDDVAQAANALAALLYKERQHLDLASENIGGNTTTYIHKLPPLVQMTLDQRKRVVPSWP